MFYIKLKFLQNKRQIIPFGLIVTTNKIYKIICDIQNFIFFWSKNTAISFLRLFELVITEMNLKYNMITRAALNTTKMRKYNNHDRSMGEL